VKNGFHFTTLTVGGPKQNLGAEFWLIKINVTPLHLSSKTTHFYSFFTPFFYSFYYKQLLSIFIAYVKIDDHLYNVVK